MGRVAAKGTLQHPARLAFGLLTRAFRRIQRPPVGAHHGGDIFGALHPPFDLEAADPRPRQFRQQIDGAEIPGGKVVALFALRTVEAAAGLGAAAAVAALAAEIGGKIALPGKREAERAMNEMLQFQRGLGADGGNFLQGQFTRQYGPAESQLLQHAHPGTVVDGHLGRGVQFQAGAEAMRQTPYRHVLHDDGIHAHQLQIGEQLRQFGQFALLDQAVDRHMQPGPALMRAGGHPFQFGDGEIFRLGPRGKVPRAAVHGVGAVFQRGEKSFQISGRGQKLRFGQCCCHRNFS